MSDNFLKRLESLENSIAELKNEYQRQAAAPAPPPAEKPENELIKIAPRNSVPPAGAPPLPPAPEHDMRTIRIKAPPLKPPGDGPAEPGTGTPEEAGAETENDFEDRDIPERMVIEWFVGRKLFGSLGMLLILVGLCYGVVYAYQNFHLTPEIRVGAACAFSILISACGFLLKAPKYRFLSLLMKGGGLGGLYMAVFAGYNIYGFFGTPATAAMMGSVALLTFALSWFERSQVVGIFAVAGAFAMPLLVKTPQSNHIFFCAYILCVNLPVIFLGLKRNWQALYNLSFVLSLLLGWDWTGEYKNLPAVVLTYWSIFTVEYLLLALVKLRGENDAAHRLSDYARIAVLVLVNLAVPYTLGNRIVPGYWLAGGTLFYAAAAATAWLTVRRMYGEFILLLGGAAAFLALATMETFTGRQGIYLAWAAEALALGIFAFFAGSRGINRLASLMAAAAWVLIHIDYTGQGALFSRSLFFNYVNVSGKLALLALLIQGGLGMWRFEKSVGSKTVVTMAGFGLIAITAVNAGYYFDWREPYLLFTALPLAVASLIYCWSAHFVPRFNCLKHISVAWFVWLLLVAVLPWRNASALWLQVLWPAGAIALYWGLPRGNLFRPFAAVICVSSVFKGVCLEKTAEITGFVNMPFAAALLGAAGFLALSWTPPWLRTGEVPVPRPYAPHGISWGIIVLAFVFCTNFFRLQGIYPSEYLLPEIGGILMMAATALVFLARQSQSRIFACYGSVLLLAVFVVGIADCFAADAAAAFTGINFYAWLILPAIGWSVLSASSGTMGRNESTLLRLVGGSLFIFVIYREFGRLPDPAFAKAFSLIFLALSAVLICGWGLWKRRRGMRLYSFVLLALAVLQLIEQSLFRLRDPARILAFIALGLLLLGLSFAYHKVSEIVGARDRAAGEDDRKH